MDDTNSIEAIEGDFQTLHSAARAEDEATHQAHGTRKLEAARNHDHHDAPAVWEPQVTRDWSTDPRHHP